MTQRVFALLIVAFVSECRGFAVPQAVARAWRRNGDSLNMNRSPRDSNSLSIGRRNCGNVSGMAMSIKEMIGADVESGGLFDPIGFSKDEPSLFRRRAVELKHGRVAMLAMMGILVQSFVRFPGFPPFAVSNAARPIAVFESFWAKEPNGVLLVLLAIGIVELTIGKQDYVDRAPGEFGNLWAFAKPVDEEEWAKVQMAEIKHGRLAMLGTMGCLVQEAVTGEGPVEQLFTGNVFPFKSSPFG